MAGIYRNSETGNIRAWEKTALAEQENPGTRTFSWITSTSLVAIIVTRYLRKRSASQRHLVSNGPCLGTGALTLRGSLKENLASEL